MERRALGRGTGKALEIKWEVTEKPPPDSSRNAPMRETFTYIDRLARQPASCFIFFVRERLSSALFTPEQFLI